MPTYNYLGSSPAANYGTDGNFQVNYRLSQSFLDAHKAPFLTSNRIWIGSYQLFRTDVADYDSMLTSDGILHTTESPTNMPHEWYGGWVPLALKGLSQDSANLP